MAEITLEAKSIVWSGVIAWAKAIEIQKERLFSAHNDRLLGLEFSDIGHRIEEHFFIIACARFFYFRQMSSELSIFDENYFEEIDAFRDVAIELRDMRTHEGEYIGARPAQRLTKLDRFQFENTERTARTGVVTAVKATQSYFDGAYRIGDRLDVDLIAAAATKFLNVLESKSNAAPSSPVQARDQ